MESMQIEAAADGLLSEEHCMPCERENAGQCWPEFCRLPLWFTSIASAAATTKNSVKIL